MRSFGLIEKYEYPHHRVLTQETPPRTNDEILLSSKKLYASTTSHNPRTSPLLPRETPLFGRIQTVSARCVQPNTAPNSPPLGLSYPRTAFPVQALPGRVSPVQEKPAQINKILKSIKIRIFPPEFCRDAYNLTPESTTYDCTKPIRCVIIYLSHQRRPEHTERHN